MRSRSMCPSLFFRLSLFHSLFYKHNILHLSLLKVMQQQQQQPKWQYFIRSTSFEWVLCMCQCTYAQHLVYVCMAQKYYSRFRLFSILSFYIWPQPHLYRSYYTFYYPFVRLYLSKYKKKWIVSSENNSLVQRMNESILFNDTSTLVYVYESIS